MTWNHAVKTFTPRTGVTSRPKKQAVCVHVGVHGCVSAYFCPPYGCDLVMCYSMFAYSHISGIILACGFLVCVQSVLWLGPPLALVFGLLLSLSMSDILSIYSSHWFKKYNLSLVLSPGETLLLQLQIELIVSLIGHLTCLMWAYLPLSNRCKYMFRSCYWLRRHRGELRTQLRPSEVRAEAVQCMMSSAVSCLVVRFTGLVWRPWLGPGEGSCGLAVLRGA